MSFSLPLVARVVYLSKVGSGQNHMRTFSHLNAIIPFSNCSSMTASLFLPSQFSSSGKSNPLHMLSLQRGEVLRWCEGLSGSKEMRLPCRELAEQGNIDEEAGKAEWSKQVKEALHDVAIALRGVKTGLEVDRGGIWKLYLGPRYEFVCLIVLEDPRVYMKSNVSTA